MKTSFIKSVAAVAAVGVAPFTLAAQDDSSADWNHFSLDARLGFNVRAKFLNVGEVAAQPALGGALNRSYSDGFVNVDSSGNQGGLTWNWGYKNPSQIQGDNLLLHSFAVDGVTSTRRDDPSLGFQFSYARDFDHESWGAWGVKFAFGYTPLSLVQRQPVTGDATQITDAYALGGIQAPLAPYSGSLNGPGAVIGSTPTRSTALVAGGATISGSRRIDADVYDFHLGPNIAFNLTHRLSLELSGGLALGVVDSAFTYSDVTTTGSGSVSSAGSGHDTGALIGVYGEGELAYRFWRSASVFVGAEFQYLGNYQQNAGVRSVQLDLSQTIFGLAGLRWSF